MCYCNTAHCAVQEEKLFRTKTARFVFQLANPDSDYDLPQDVIDKTIAKYEEAYEMLTGKKL